MGSMKKILIGIAMAALVLAGCGESDTPATEAPTTNAQQSQPENQTAPETPTLAECATDCVDEYSAAIDALEACDTFGDAQGCDDAIRDLEALHDPILATHGTQAAAQVALVESRIAEWDEGDCAEKSSCALQLSMATLEARQLRLDMKQY